ncbi:DUF2332 domain-containing protein [Halobacteriales archaeon QS_4_69_34]|nr:MAG: DUF2332 domain-containing protein [Halobacteriales archaeon QS_4_69_34]
MGLAEEFRNYAAWAEGATPLYARLARDTADDPALLDLAAGAPAGQPAPQLLLAAVHSLLLASSEHPLAEHYPTCADGSTDERRTAECSTTNDASTRGPATVDPFPTFREFCLERGDAIREIVGTRRVQTNAVGRSAVLLPAFEHVVHEARRASGRGAASPRARESGGEPLALVEIGTSAGLNLYWDRFRYEYAGRGRYGDPGSPVRIESAVRGDADPPLPDPTPSVTSRLGIDRHPLDATDPDDRCWLRALVPPDHAERHERLAAALELVAEDPPALVAGDALDVLPSVLDDAPANAALCVFSTLTLYQLGEAKIERLRDLLAAHSHERTVHWLSGDPSVDTDAPAYRHVVLSNGKATEIRLAAFEAYGRWIEWLASDAAIG